jgi:uncharacterized membrane protein YidH (DUF202 family)
VASDIFSTWIFIGIGLVVIGMGALTFHYARYLAAPEDKKQGRAKNLQWYAVVWLCIGLANLIGGLLVLRG